MGKHQKVVLSVEAVKKIFRDLSKEQEQTLLTIVSNSAKLIHQRLDKLVNDIIDINEKLKENVKDVDELKQGLQMYQDTNDNKLVETVNSIEQQEIECIAQVEDIQLVYNELKEKIRNLEDRSRGDNIRVDGIPEYEEESWDDTEELLKDALREKLDRNKIQIERVHRVAAQEAGRNRTIVAKFSSYKGKQRVLNQTRCQKREDIYIYEDFSKATVAIRKENSEKTKALRQQGKYAILVYDKIYLPDKL